ncbi:MAG TPA: N-6 DNA methylase, partial [Gemmatimonadaceae bacterium]|nr:N-6 DNA methylase [Gemmatimonadaceae bacterium]
MHDSPALRKARGAFFTPPAITRFLADWALRTASDSVLEPSCGEAGFLLAAGDRLRALGAGGLGDMRLHGIEVHGKSARVASEILASRGFSAKIDTADFFAVEPRAMYDAVLGNPPYVRYQSFSGTARTRSLEAALKHGVRLTGLASSWAAFAVHASQFLKPGGRLGLVLPAELLTVNYAAEVRRFLLNRFATIRLVMFEELVFPGVLEEVVLLLAEGQGSAPKFEVFQARRLDDLDKREQHSWSWFTPER